MVKSGPIGSGSNAIWILNARICICKHEAAARYDRVADCVARSYPGREGLFPRSSIDRFTQVLKCDEIYATEVYICVRERVSSLLATCLLLRRTFFPDRFCGWDDNWETFVPFFLPQIMDSLRKKIGTFLCATDRGGYEKGSLGDVMARTYRTSPFTRHFIHPRGNIALSFWLRPCKRTSRPPKTTPTELSAAPELFSSYAREKRVVFSLFYRHAFGSILFTASKRGYHREVIWQYNFQAMHIRFWSKYYPKLSCVSLASHASEYHVINCCNWKTERFPQKSCFFSDELFDEFKIDFYFWREFWERNKKIKILWK